uniref:Uncharacterized protein n=1 Tax=Glossina palpalis gambiensis TaxID=67801 RepID=A0A1B0BRE8_9MUSC
MYIHIYIYIYTNEAFQYLLQKAAQLLQNVPLFLKLMLKIFIDRPENYNMLVQVYTNMNNTDEEYNDIEMRQKLSDYLESNYADEFWRLSPSHMPNGLIYILINVFN